MSWMLRVGNGAEGWGESAFSLARTTRKQLWKTVALDGSRRACRRALLLENGEVLPALGIMAKTYETLQGKSYRRDEVVACDADGTPGRLIVSPKIDGETWFLHKDEHGTRLLSPTGRIIERINLTIEADLLLGEWQGLMAGELYATVERGRPHVFDLHAALGGGPGATTGRLRWAAFDLLCDGDMNTQNLSFLQCTQRLQELLKRGGSIHAVPFEEVDSGAAVREAFERLVTREGAEGIVVASEDGRAWKIKPHITLDAAVVGFVRGGRGACELLLALWRDDPPEGKACHSPDASDVRPEVTRGHYQLIGRVSSGLSGDEQSVLLERLESLSCEAPLPLASRNGQPYEWVRPELAIEVRVHEILTRRGRGEKILRWALTHGAATNWSPLGRRPAISLRDAVFVRRREDKSASPLGVRWDQVRGCLDEVEPMAPTALPASTILLREVYTRPVTEGAQRVRKLVVWKTNKEVLDPRHPAFVALWTDFAPGRDQPLQTTLFTSPMREETLNWAKTMRERHLGRGWQGVVSEGEAAHEQAAHEPRANLAKAPNAPELTIGFARSGSPTFPVVRRRLSALAELGRLEITGDARGKEIWFELTVGSSLIAGLRRVNNLLSLVRRWKTLEMKLAGEPLSPHEVDDVLARLEEIRRCWSRRQNSSIACRRDCPLGCSLIRIIPPNNLSASGARGPLWFTLGKFDGQAVTVNKTALRERLEATRNRLLAACPHYSSGDVVQHIDALPNKIDSSMDGWRTAYERASGAPGWIWPADQPLPPALTVQPLANHHGAASSDRLSPHGAGNHRHGLGITMDGGNDSLIPRPALRQVPSAAYEDVRGQEQAVRAVRDLIELPMRYGHLFEAVGARPCPGGVILAGPPGTGKTLLARAVASGCGAHLELVGGPELLSPYVGASEKALRQVFERAAQAAPALIVFDELDSFAPVRQRAEAQHQQALVAQLLTLLDGLEPRRAVYVLATTNRPQAIDPALRRPGRFDRVVTMGLPDQSGRAAILDHHLAPLRLAEGLDRNHLSAWLATQTRGASGADLAHLCQSAVRCCVHQELERRERERPDHALRAAPNVRAEDMTATYAVGFRPALATPIDLSITQEHFDLSLREWLVENPSISSISKQS